MDQEERRHLVTRGDIAVVVEGAGWVAGPLQPEPDNSRQHQRVVVSVCHIF